MERFVRERLLEVKPDAPIEPLIAKTVERSEGVFLWTSLVVQRLRQCLFNDLSLQSMEEELASLPSKLKSLFQHLLHSIGSATKVKAYQIFLLITRLNPLNTNLPPVLCLFLEYYNRDSEFATHERLPMELCTGTDREERRLRYNYHLGNARKLIQDCCRGLVEVRKIRHGDPANISSDGEGLDEVVFTHRTILEFLQSEGMEEMNAQSAIFDVVDAFPRLLYATLRFLGGTRYNICCHELIIAAVSLQYQAKSTSNYHLISRIESTMRTCFDPDRGLANDLDKLPFVPYVIQNYVWPIMEGDARLRDFQFTVYPFSAPLLAMACVGNLEYASHCGLLEDKTSYSLWFKLLFSISLLHGVIFTRIQNHRQFIKYLAWAIAGNTATKLEVRKSCARILGSLLVQGYSNNRDSLNLAAFGEGIQMAIKAWGAKNFQFRCSNDEPRSLSVQWETPYVKHDFKLEQYLADDLFSGRQFITLPDVIECWDFPNKAEILALLHLSESSDEDDNDDDDRNDDDDSNSNDGEDDNDHEQNVQAPKTR